MKKVALMSLIVVGVLFLSACNQVSKSFHDTFQGKPQKSKFDDFVAADDSYKENNFLTNGQRLANAEKALKNLPEFKGKPIKLVGDMHLYDDGRIMLSVQDPDTLANVNGYEYSRDGEWGSGQPVKLNGDINADMVSKGAIPLENLHFVTVAKMAKIYADSAKHVGSSTIINHIYYEPTAQKWYCNDIETPRASYEMYFNPDGTVKEFIKE